MVWKSAYERAVELVAAGERLREERLAANWPQPPPDPFEPEFRYLGAAMTGQQTPPPYKDAYTREAERLAEMDQRRLARENGGPRPQDAPGESARILASRAVDPNRPKPKPQRDPRLGASTYVLANRAQGRPDDYEDAGDDADG